MERDGWFGLKTATFVHAFLGVSLALGGWIAAEYSRGSETDYALRLSPDGRYLVRVVGGLRLVDLRTGSAVGPRDDDALRPEFGPDGRLAYARFGRGAPGTVDWIRTWDPTNGAVADGPPGGRALPLPGGGLAVVPGRPPLGMQPNQILIHDPSRAEGGMILRPFADDPGDGEEIHALAVSGDGRRIAVELGRHNGRGSRVALWGLDEGEPIAEHPFDLHIADLRFTPDDRSLIVALGASDAGAWVDVDASDGRLRRRVEVGDFVWSAAVSPDGGTLAVGTSPVGLWDFAEGRRLRTLEGDGLVRSVAFDGPRLLAATTAGKVLVWEWATGSPVGRAQSPPPPPDGTPWIAGAAGAAWLLLLVPIGRKAAALRRASTPYRPSFGLRALAFAVVPAVLAPSFIVGGGYWVSGFLELMTGAGIQVAAGGACLLGALAFLALRIPFRKRVLFPLGAVLAGSGLLQVWVLGEIIASC